MIKAISILFLGLLFSSLVYANENAEYGPFLQAQEISEEKSEGTPQTPKAPKEPETFSMEGTKVEIDENEGTAVNDGSLENSDSLQQGVVSHFTYESKEVDRDQDNHNKWIFQYRYLGVLSQIGLERALGAQVSLGLYYGRYAGKVAGTDKLGFIPDLEHAALQINAYLNSEKLALGNGLVTRFALHVNRQKENDLVKSIQVDGVDVIVPGQTKVGTLLGIGYQWSWKKISLNAGMEYLTMGPLKSFVPLALGVGVTF